MDDKKYERIKNIILLFGAISIFGLFFYTKHLYEIGSIISYIANRG